MDWSRTDRWLGAGNGSPASRLGPHNRLQIVIVLALLAISFAAEAIARAFLPLLLQSHPLLLIILDSHTHYLLLASVKVGAGAFIAVAVAWRFTVHMLYYLLARWYGNSALQWLGKRFRLGKLIISKTEQIFAHVASPAVFFLSDDLVCVLAGAAGMSPLRFAVLHLLGTVMHAVLLWVFAAHIHGALVPAVSFIDSAAVSLTVIFVVLAIGSLALTASLHRGSLRELAGLLRAPGTQPTPAAGESAAGEKLPDAKDPGP